MSSREVPASEAAIRMNHVGTCACAYIVGPFADGKLIDVRCIEAYIVPAPPVVNMNMPMLTRPQDWAEPARAILQERGAWRAG